MNCPECKAPLPPDWCGHEWRAGYDSGRAVGCDGHVAEIARLREALDEALARAALTKEDQRTSQHCSHCGHADIDHASNDGSCVAPDCWCAALAGGSE